MSKNYLKISLTFIVILVSCFICFGCDGIGDGFSNYNDRFFRLISNDDNKDFDNELYDFASKNNIDLEIVHSDDLVAISSIEANPSYYDAMWLSNSTWIYMLNGVRTLNSKSTNINPVVFGIKKKKAEQLGFTSGEVYNRDLVNAIKDKKLKYVMSSVTKTNTGMIAYLGFLNSLSGSPEILTKEMLENDKLISDLTALFSGVERVSGTDDFLREMFLNSDDYEAVIATESSLISINKELTQNNKDPLFLIYPVDGVALNDSPFAYIDNGQEKLEMFNLLQSFILSKESQQKLEYLGKRTWYGGVKKDADGSSFKKEWGIDTTKYLIPLKYPSKAVMDEAMSLYIDTLRKPSATVFCVDYSGSMYGDGERQLEDAMEYILSYDRARDEMIQFSSKDKVYVIPFSDKNKNLLTSSGRDTEKLISSINSLNPGGGTNIYGCVSEGLKRLKEVDDSYTKTVILMTDGESNLGSFKTLSNDYKEYGKGIPVYSIMFGSAKDYQLQEIADLSNAKVFDGRANLVEAFKEVRSYN